MNNTAKILRDNVSEIMRLWRDEVVETVPAAKLSNDVALFNHLPNVIIDIADIMQRYHNMEDIHTDKKFADLVASSIIHGKHRATTVNYTVDQVVREYVIFHRTLRDYIEHHNGFDKKMSDLLTYIMETSIIKAVASFSQSLREMQEKLIGTLAHDIRNPLAAAKLSLEMIEQDKTGLWKDKARKSAYRSVMKSIHLIEGLMNGITVQAGEGMLFNFQKVNILEDIHWVWQESLDIYAHDIILICNTDIIVGVFDSIAIKRLLENLIGNAVKYGASEEPITITITNEDDGLMLSVHNHGQPIPDIKQAQIFEFLGSAHEDGEDIVAGSWGMGLTLTKIVAEAHGGDVNVISDQKSGTQFIVNLVKNFNKIGKKRAKVSLKLTA